MVNLIIGLEESAGQCPECGSERFTDDAVPVCPDCTLVVPTNPGDAPRLFTRDEAFAKVDNLIHWHAARYERNHPGTRDDIYQEAAFMFCRTWTRDLPEKYLPQFATWAFYKAAKKLKKQARLTSIDGIGEGGGYQPADYRAVLPGLEEVEERNRVRRKVNKALGTLPPMRRREVERRFGLNGYQEHTLRELDDRYEGCSHRRIAKSLASLAGLLHAV